VRRSPKAALLARLLLLFVLVGLSGLSPIQHAASQALARANRAIEFNSPASAADQLGLALSYFPWRTDLWDLAGRAALRAGDQELAYAQLQFAAQSDKLSARGYLALGDVARLRGDLPAAEAVWQLALKRGAPAEEVHLRLLDLHRAMGDYTAAIGDLRALVALQPAEASYQFRLGLMLATQEPEAALAYLTTAGELQPELAAAGAVIGRSLSGARSAGDRAYSLLASGRALADLGEWQLAAEAFRQATLAQPDYAEAWAYLGEAEQRAAAQKAGPEDTLDETTGRDELDRALALDPNSVAANLFQVIYWQRQGRYELALVYLHRAADQEFENPVVQAEIGNTLGQLGNYADAQAYYQQAVDLAPRDPTFLRALVSFSLRYDYQVRELALPAARRAILLNQNDPASLDVLGQVFIRLGDLYSAKRFFDRALLNDPGYARARLHLGLFYTLTGQETSAKEQLLLARSLSGEEPQIADQANRLMNNLSP